MSNVVSFPKDKRFGSGGKQPLAVTITDRYGSTLFSCSLLPPEDGGNVVVPVDPVGIAFVRAALRHALKQLDGPDKEPEIGADYTA